MLVRIKEAHVSDVSQIVDFLSAMQIELNEFDFDRQIFEQSITGSFEENVNWFLFVDENDQIFGTCHLQCVHSYWRLGRRYYLGAFYIIPSHRGCGYFKKINTQLKDWVIARGGVQIYCHIHKDNEKSIKTFESVGMDEVEYVLRVNHWGS